MSRYLAARGLLAGGDCDYPEEVYWRHDADSWEDAKSALLPELATFLTDTCSCCREDGTQEYEALLASNGPTWQGFVDGHDYWIAVV